MRLLFHYGGLDRLITPYKQLLHVAVEPDEVHIYTCLYTHLGTNVQKIEEGTIITLVVSIPEEDDVSKCKKEKKTMGRLEQMSSHGSLTKCLCEGRELHPPILRQYYTMVESARRSWNRLGC